MTHIEAEFALRFKTYAETLLNPGVPLGPKLIFHKRSHGYGLAVVFLEGGPPTPILSCPLDVRVLTSGRFDALYDACVASEAATVERLQKAIENARQYLQKLP